MTTTSAFDPNPRQPEVAVTCHLSVASPTLRHPEVVATMMCQLKTVATFSLASMTSPNSSSNIFPPPLHLQVSRSSTTTSQFCICKLVLRKLATPPEISEKDLKSNKRTKNTKVIFIKPNQIYNQNFRCRVEVRVRCSE
jgi:hypothetical protein